MTEEKSNLEDLVDFYNQWPILREQVLTLSQGDTLTENQARILQQAFHVVNCVGPQDLIQDG